MSEVPLWAYRRVLGGGGVLCARYLGHFLEALGEGREDV